MSYRRKKAAAKKNKVWHSFASLPFGKALVAFAAIAPVAYLIATSPSFLNLLIGYQNPNEVASHLALATSVGGALLAGFLFIRPKPYGKKSSFPWPALGMLLTLVVWGLSVRWILQTAVPQHTAEQYSSFPQSFTPIDSSRDWTSIISMQNIGLSNSEITLTALPADNDYSKTITELAPGETWLIDAAEEPIDNTENAFGMVGASSQPSYAVVFLEGKSKKDNESVLRLSYSAMESQGRKLYFPSVKNNYNGVSSSYSIQNSGSVPTNFRARFVMEDGKEYEFISPVELQPGESYFLSLEEVGVLPATTEPGRLGSLIVDANEPLNALVYEHAAGDSTTMYGFTAAQSARESFTRAFIPERGIGKIISIIIVNVDTTPIDVSVSYGVSGAAAGCIQKPMVLPKYKIQPDSAISITQKEYTQMAGCAPWARLEGTGKFVTFTSETNSDDKAITSVSYRAFEEAEVTKFLAVPFFADRYKGIASRLHVRNIHEKDSVKFYAKFQCSTENKQKFSFETETITLEPSGVYEFYDLANHPDILKTNSTYYPNAWCSVMVISSHPIVGYVTETSENINLNTRVNYDAMNLDSIATGMRPAE